MGESTQEEVIAKAVEWLQAMDRGEKITLDDEEYLYYIKRDRNRFKVFFERDLFRNESSLTVSDLLYSAQKVLKKEGKNAKT